MITSLEHTTLRPIINCTGCRCGACFPHLLYRYISSAEAILLTTSFRGEADWHRFHGVRESSGNSLRRYEAQKQRYEEVLEEYDIVVRLAVILKEYMKAVPDVRDSSLKLGWYDLPDLPEVCPSLSHLCQISDLCDTAEQNVNPGLVPRRTWKREKEPLRSDSEEPLARYTASQKNERKSLNLRSDSEEPLARYFSGMGSSPDSELTLVNDENEVCMDSLVSKSG